jgi:hypothetical protein
MNLGTILRQVSNIAIADCSIVNGTITQLAKISDIDETIVELTITQLAKIAIKDSNLLLPIANQLVKIAEINSKLVEPIITRLSKIADIDISAVDPIMIQLTKIADIDSSLVEPVIVHLAKIAEINIKIAETILTQLVKISIIDPSVVVQMIIQLSKISQVDQILAEHLIKQFLKVMQLYPTKGKSLLDSISDGQLASKSWMVEKIEEFDLGNVFLCGGWYAMILCDQRLKFKQCISFDIDPSCEDIAKIIHKSLVIDGWKFQACTQDIININYYSHSFAVKRTDGSLCDLYIIPDTIINTSCEHIEKFVDWYKSLPSNKLLILQSNNYFQIEDHVNCSSSLEEFEYATPMSSVLFSGELVLDKYTRYMRIGYK